ncbi:hypothetical protein F2Q69_00050650 [Brassica cretica]|uniref:Uncharacterized protein n=1 Tax=Brassica cretica TaxID=69181 RepID=A0A8S9PTG0_BRACR|nr:hypothetical protein F2Q69_00050650 [Brassica cretica]
MTRSDLGTSLREVALGAGSDLRWSLWDFAPGFSGKVAPTRKWQTGSWRRSAEIFQRILDALDQIQSNTEQIVKLLTDVHGFGPHPSAAVSIKRQRTEEAEERGNSEESEKKQNEEKLQEKKEDGGGEILQDQNLQPQQ